MANIEERPKFKAFMALGSESREKVSLYPFVKWNDQGHVISVRPVEDNALAVGIEKLRTVETAFMLGEKGSANNLVNTCEAQLPLFVRHGDRVNAIETICLLGRVIEEIVDDPEGSAYVLILAAEGMDYMERHGMEF